MADRKAVKTVKIILLLGFFVIYLTVLNDLNISGVFKLVAGIFGLVMSLILFMIMVAGGDK